MKRGGILATGLTGVNAASDGHCNESVPCVIVSVMRTIWRASALVAALLALQIVDASPASAALRDQSWEFGAYLSGAFLDNDSNVDNNFGVGVRVGYFFLKDHAIEMSIDDTFSEVSNDSDLNANLFTVKVGYLYTFMPLHRVTPYIFLGGGVQNLTVYEDFCDDDDWWDENDWWDDCYDELIDETDPVAYGGIGLRIFIGDSWSIRTDYQGVYVWPDDGDEDLLVDQIVSVGVSWTFGGAR